MKLYIYEKDYNLATGKTATDEKPSSEQTVDLNNPMPIDFTDKDYTVYKNAKSFSSDENGKPMISYLKSGAVIVTDKTGIQLYITDKDKKNRVFIYNKVITDKETAKTTTQNILNKLKNQTLDTTISTLENTSSGFTEVFVESVRNLRLFNDTDFIIK